MRRTGQPVPAGGASPVRRESFARTLLGALDDVPTVMLRDPAEARTRIAVLRPDCVFVCWGFEAGTSTIGQAVAEGDLRTAEDFAEYFAEDIAEAIAEAIGEANRAGTICGSGRPELRAFLKETRTLVAAG